MGKSNKFFKQIK